MIVAASKNFKIIFDFNHDAINVVDPTTDRYTQGKFYISGKIYIGAKQLLDQAIEHEAIAVLAHEICHFVMNIVFGNMAKPYRRNDNKTMQEFKNISSKCEKIRDVEKMIDIIYDSYPEEMYHAELIVRVVHLIALYRNLPEKLDEVRNKFSKLFDFYELKIVPELEKALPEIEAGDEKELEEKNKIILKYKKMAIIFGILAVLGIASGASAAWYAYGPNDLFHKFIHGKQLEDLNKSVLFQNEGLQKNYLFLKDSEEYNNLAFNHNPQLLNISHPLLPPSNSSVTYNWLNLTVELKENFLNSSFFFQDESLKFKMLNDLAPKAFYSLTSDKIKFII